MGDLRTERTRAAIREAFMTLRAKKSLEKITVKELAEHARINKATFYLHYRDIYDLSEQIEDQILFSSTEKVEPRNLFLEDPAQFVQELIDACAPQLEAIEIVFSGNRASVLPEKIETQLKQRLLQQDPRMKDNLKSDVLLSYVIHGAFRAYIKHKNQSPLEALAAVVEITKNIGSLYQEQLSAEEQL